MLICFFGIYKNKKLVSNKLRETMNLHQLRFVREAVRQNFNLTEAAKAYGSVDLYIGDDGLIHGC